MQTVAVLGASGFIGMRTVELFCLEDDLIVRPIVRNVHRLNDLPKLPLDRRVADALDPHGLELALQDCDAVVHVVVGNPSTIRRSVEATYWAAQRAGVKRMVYLSTACVHGQTPEPGTTEASALSDRQPLAYNNAKVQAERKLLALRQQGDVEVVVLRPSIVYGPRSRWTAGLADQLLQGQAYLIDQGQGICNTLYVDNLVQAIRAALVAPGVDGQAFLVGDRETVTWAEFYGAIAESLGIDPAEIPRIAAPRFKPSLKQRLVDPLKNSDLVQIALSRLKRQRGGPVTSSCPPQTRPTEWHPAVTQEIVMLQQGHYKLPYQKATDQLGYTPLVSFAEGCRRSVDWLTMAGYPVLNYRRQELISQSQRQPAI